MDKHTIENKITSLASEIKSEFENNSTKNIPEMVEKATQLYKKIIVWEHLSTRTHHPELKTIEFEVTEDTTESIVVIEEPVPIIQEEIKPSVETPTIQTEVPVPEPEIISPSHTTNTSAVDIKTHIGFNDKLEFINELFNGNTLNYETCIAQVNSAASLEQALSTYSNFKTAYGWSDENESAVKLQEIIQIAFR